MTDQSQRMQRLRLLLVDMRKAQATYASLEKQARLAKIAYDQAQTRYRNYMDDLIGDLFNGCFGEEWLLDIAPGTDEQQTSARISSEELEEINEHLRNELSSQIQCSFVEAWIGRCKNMTDGSYPYCSLHADKRCACGKQAKRNCEVTLGAFVCGQLTCGKCTHSH